jgi:competence ComEA-like helix-hairpin-helix protein
LLVVSVGCAVLAWKKWRPAAVSGYRIITQMEDADTIVRGASSAATKLHDGINPTTASQEDLELLPGIGPRLARRIIETRQAEGPFEKPGDLLKVPGIGSRSLTRLTPYLSFP